MVQLVLLTVLHFLSRSVIASSVGSVLPSGKSPQASAPGISRIAGEDRRGLKAFDDQPDAQRKLKERDRKCGQLC
jgi:hypothetical protein